MTISKLSASEQETITDAVLANSLKSQQEKGPDLRQLHPKSHALVWGEFIVENDIPPALKVGVFATVQTYPIWVRFSNAAEAEKRGKFASDKQPNAHGLAIKLMSVEGEKVLDDEDKTQDFILLNHPVFFLRDVKGYVDIGKVASGQADPELTQAMQPSFAILQEITSTTRQKSKVKSKKKELLCYKLFTDFKWSVYFRRCVLVKKSAIHFSFSTGVRHHTN